MKVSGIKYQQGRNAYTDNDGKKYGIAIHNTSNNASAQQEANYAQTRTDGISSHFYVDGTTVIQSLDTLSRAGHAGSATGNDNSVAFEITGFNTYTRQQWLDGVAWDKLGYVIAELREHDPNYSGLIIARASVSEMRSNPKVRKFYAHDDMRQAWGGTTHTDPGPNFPWDRLFQAVNDAYEGGGMTNPWNEAETNSTVSRVGAVFLDQATTTWKDNDGVSKSETNALSALLHSMDAKLDAIAAAIEAGGVGTGLVDHTHSLTAVTSTGPVQTPDA